MSPEQQLPLRVLVLEDQADDAQLIVLTLERAGFSLVWDRVVTEADFARQMHTSPYDVILSDYSLPSFNALAALRWLQQRQFDLPFIIVSGTIGDDAAVAALHLGATDYLLKDRLGRLPSAVTRALRQKQTQDEKRHAQEALRRSEERFSKAFHNSPVATCLTTPDGTFIDVNLSFQTMFGYARDEVVGHTSQELQVWATPGQRSELAESMLAHQMVKDVEAKFRIKSGEVRVGLASAVAIQSDDQVSILTHLHDITDRIQAEEKIRLQLEQMRALRAIDIAISAGMDVHLTLNVVIDHVISLLNVHGADILLLDAFNQELVFAAGRGIGGHPRGGRLRLGEGRAGKVAFERLLVHIHDLRELPEEPAAGESANPPGFVSYVGVPLIAKGQVKGVLEIFHRDPLEVSDEWLEFLETLAGQAAIALDNAGLYEELQQSHTRLALAYDATIEGWSSALDLRDKETEGHSQRVTELSLALAAAMGMAGEALRYMRWGALLHDIGKMGIPDAILLKPALLTEAEWVIMRQHPVLANALLAPIAYLRPALEIPYCHHEKWDGTGYPRGLHGEQIPPAARIFTVVDVWDALLSDRPYRPAWTQAQARDHIRSLAGIQFDPEVAQAFLQLV